MKLSIQELAHKIKSCNYLEKISHYIQFDMKLNFLVGVEIEFYLENLSIDQIQKVIPDLLFYDERGNNQFEYSIGPTNKTTDLVNEIIKSKNLIETWAEKLGGKAIFSAKPFNDFGSAMQFNFSFPNKPKEFLDRAAAAFCLFTNRTNAIFLSIAEDYRRLDHNFMAPTHISFGSDNRSCLVRIIYSELRLEHRLASSSCDPYLCLTTLLLMLCKIDSISSEIINTYKVYGNSFDPQYNLEMLPKNIEESVNLFDYSFFDPLFTLNLNLVNLNQTR